MTEDFEGQVESLAALADPARRALYRYVAASSTPVSRDEAAEALGMARHVVKFHLDRMQDEGLLDVEFRRANERRGPGAGRPSKFYRRSDREFRVNLPERRYDLAGHLMAEAITRSTGTGQTVEGALRQAAEACGERLGEQAGRAGAVSDEERACRALEGQGYEPREEGGRIVLSNCPFHALAQDFTGLVCGMNLDLLDGFLRGLGSEQLAAKLDPAPDRCCVVLERKSQ